MGEPAYYKNLSFDNDLNPQCGSQEATALVTRFTTKDRIGAGVSPQYPVMVRALTRAEWLRVLARGFHAECKTPATTWQQAELETLFEDFARKFPDQQVDRKWRMDILDAFSYMRAVDRRGFQATEAVINGLLSRYPLTEDGYVAAAAALFWDSWPSLTSQFNKVAAFLKRITLGNHDPAIFCHWAGVRFLLDSQRSKVLRAAQFQDLETRRLERHLPHAQGQVLRPGLPPQHGHGHRGAGDDPGAACWNWSCPCCRTASAKTGGG